MKTEDQLYGLMAQAEDIQEHAVTLQKTALKAISALEGATQTVGAEMRSRGLFWAFCGAVIALIVGILVVMGTYYAIKWTTANLQEERNKLRDEVIELEEKAKEFKLKAGKASLSTCKGRICIRVNEKYGQFGDVDKGEIYMVIHGY